MKKWLIRFIIVVGAILLYFSHLDLLAFFSNFMIDGLVPGTHFVVDTFWTYIIAASCFYLIYKLIKSLRFDMLKRDAILYNQEKQSRQYAQSDKKIKSTLLEAEDLELAQRSL
jgi:hypothetical protein